MAAEKTRLEEILSALENGERLGLDEARHLISQSSKLFGGKDAERFFETAQKVTLNKPDLIEFYCPPFKISNPETNDLLERISKTHAEIIYLDFSPNLSFEDILSVIHEVSKHVNVSALSPTQLMSLAKKQNCRVLELCHEISSSGISYVPGVINCAENDLSTIDEVFSVMMMLSKVSIKSSAWLPLSFSDEAKIEHLSRIREFDDRSHAITHVFFDLNTSYSDHDLMKTIAIGRLMLDFSDRLSFVDYQTDYSKTLPQKLRSKCMQLGINQIGVV